jgi:solute carrier family 25 (mitochondrial phosphate transporter), member 23/24/25/41
MALSDYPSISNCLKTIYKKEKIRGIYSGLAPSVLGIFPYAGIDLAVNSVLKE